MDATFYPASDDAHFLGHQTLQFGASAAMILKTFTDARSSQIRAVQNLLKPHEVEISPPLIVAHALASAETLQGFRRIIRELKHDKRVARLRKLVIELSEASPHEQIRACKFIEKEMWKILDLENSASLETAEAFRIVPKIFSGGLEGVLTGASSIFKIDQFIEELRIRSRLNILRELHSSVPNVSDFYGKLVRIFGPVRFSERELRVWLKRPWSSSRAAYEMPSKRLKKDIWKSLNALNKMLGSKR